MELPFGLGTGSLWVSVPQLDYSYLTTAPIHGAYANISPLKTSSEDNFPPIDLGSIQFPLWLHPNQEILIQTLLGAKSTL